MVQLDILSRGRGTERLLRERDVSTRTLRHRSDGDQDTCHTMHARLVRRKECWHTILSFRLAKNGRKEA